MTLDLRTIKNVRDAGEIRGFLNSDGERGKRLYFTKIDYAQFFGKN